MKKINIAICDDEEVYRSGIQNYLELYASEKELQFSVNLYESGMDLVKAVEQEQKQFHIVFLDVEMPEMNGVETAKRIREQIENVNIAFITSYQGYALHAFEVEAIGYMMKPATYEGIKKIMDKAVVLSCYDMDREQGEQKYLEIQCNKEKKVIEKSKISYIEKCRNKCQIHLIDGEIACYETLSSIFGRLRHPDFIYIHQGYIVNFSKIKEVKDKMVSLGEGIELPVSRKYYKVVKEMHMDKIYRLRIESAN